ncbi:hypothetical protein B0H16DRAFT_1463843 [Mycena metata]|uniref:Uncharacterized protein n=1 Tax=Mycena metata TaxID=1033252 RepID=A0AAD7N2X1_9AGAR|nr:hypothetical protein B0H16DRAFT_1463843 [Mycena metata]
MTISGLCVLVATVDLYLDITDNHLAVIPNGSYANANELEAASKSVKIILYKNLKAHAPYYPDACTNTSISRNNAHNQTTSTLATIPTQKVSKPQSPKMQPISTTAGTRKRWRTAVSQTIPVPDATTAPSAPKEPKTIVSHKKKRLEALTPPSVVQPRNSTTRGCKIENAAPSCDEDAPQPALPAPSAAPLPAQSVKPKGHKKRCVGSSANNADTPHIISASVLRSSSITNTVTLMEIDSDDEKPGPFNHRSHRAKTLIVDSDIEPDLPAPNPLSSRAPFKPTKNSIAHDRSHVAR